MKFNQMNNNKIQVNKIWNNINKNSTNKSLWVKYFRDLAKIK